MAYLINSFLASDPVVTVSGETITDGPVNGANAGVYFRTDGTVDKRVNDVYTQIDASTDWIIPNGEASSLYEIRATKTSGFTNPSTGSDSLDTWLSMSVDRKWFAEVTVNTVAFTLDIDIRYDGGAILSTGSYVIEAEGAF